MTGAAVKLAPGYADHVGAIQHPRQLFSVPELQAAVFDVDFLSLPLVASGASAVVFKANVRGNPKAVRCYTNISASGRERYDALGLHVMSRGPACAAMAEWLDDAIRVNRETWPVLRMEWVEGRPLDRYVDYLARQNNQAALTVLAAVWLDLVGDLDRADFAHGDLQHGNVLVDEFCRLRLVDFDGVWLPGLSGSEPPGEAGHHNYQHPNRRTTGRWDRWIDTFSELVFYLSLKTIAVDPSLWGELHKDDQSIFKAPDFCPPFGTRVWKRLFQLAEPEITALDTILQACRDPAWEERVTLEHLIASTVRCPARLPASSNGVPWPVNLPVSSLPKPPTVSSEARLLSSVVTVGGVVSPGGSRLAHSGAGRTGKSGTHTQGPIAPAPKQHRPRHRVAGLVVDVVALLILASLWLAFTQLRRPNGLEFFGLVAATVGLIKEFRKDLTGRKP